MHIVLQKVSGTRNIIFSSLKVQDNSWRPFVLLISRYQGCYQRGEDAGT